MIRLPQPGLEPRPQRCKAGALTTQPIMPENTYFENEYSSLSHLKYKNESADLVTITVTV